MLHFLLVSSPIFAVVAIGFAAARLGLLAPAGIAAFTAYAFDLALPALVVSLLARQPLAEAFDARFFAALLGAGLAVFAATGERELLKRFRPDRPGEDEADQQEEVRTPRDLLRPWDMGR